VKFGAMDTNEIGEATNLNNDQVSVALQILREKTLVKTSAVRMGSGQTKKHEAIREHEGVAYTSPIQQLISSKWRHSK